MSLLVSKIISIFVVPPGLFVLLLIIILGLHYKNKQKAVSFFLFFTIILMYLMSSYLGEVLLVKTLEDDFEPFEPVGMKDVQKSAIVVLGGGVVRGSPQGLTQLGHYSLMRVYEGFRLHKQTGYDIWLSGGKVFSNLGGSEAQVMKRVLIDWGVNEEKIFLEKGSNNTWENAKYTCEALKHKGYERIILVTNAVHMRRSMYSFKAHWDQAIIPAPCGYMLGRDTNILDFLPNKNALINCMSSIHEWIGLLWYRARY